MCEQYNMFNAACLCMLHGHDVHIPALIAIICAAWGQHKYLEMFQSGGQNEEGAMAKVNAINPYAQHQHHKNYYSLLFPFSMGCRYVGIHVCKKAGAY